MAVLLVSVGAAALDSCLAASHTAENLVKRRLEVGQEIHSPHVLVITLSTGDSCSPV